jgi:hypothetical protein
MLDDGKRLTSIWKHRLQQVLSTETVDFYKAEHAVSELYKALGLTPPPIAWYKGERSSSTWSSGESRAVPVNDTHQPVLGVADRLLYGLWFKLPDIERLMIPIGYNPARGMFRMTANKLSLFGNFRVKRMRGGYLRPLWTRNLGNMICQFDAPALALFEYATGSQVRLERGLRTLGEAVQQLLDTTFGAILFDEMCVLVDRPRRISLDEQSLISSTSGSAFAEKIGGEIFAVNGVILPYDAIRLKNISWYDLLTETSPQRRVAMIEYMGWDKFLKVAVQKVILDTDPHWGTLYNIQCGLQVMLVLEVRNATPEPDGKFRKYVIPVDHLCRPIPNPLQPHAVLGDPQELTALNAVASTFGMTGEAYKSMLGAES